MNTDGPSFIDEFGKFVLTLPDYEAMVKKIQELETRIQKLESKK